MPPNVRVYSYSAAVHLQHVIAPFVSKAETCIPSVSPSIPSNLGKIQKIKGRSNYQYWESTMEEVFELEGLWDIASRKQLRPSETRTATSAIRGSTSFDITLLHSDTLEAWVTSARRAWITIDLPISNDLRHTTETSKGDPVALWKHLEKQHQPDAPNEASRMYQQLLEIQPKNGVSGRDDRASRDSESRTA